MTEVTIVGLDLAKRVFQVPRPMAALLFARNCHEVRCWHFSQTYRLASLLWRPVPRPIIGPVRSVLWGISSGWCRLPMSNLSSSAKRMMRLMRSP